jgi:putative transposase
MGEHKNPPMSIRHQCQLLDIARSGLYYAPRGISEKDLELMFHIDQLFLNQPTLGTRSMRDQLWRKHGLRVNRKRLQRLYQKMGLVPIHPKAGTSKPGKGHRIYPYLLRNLPITVNNQVWSADITYIPMKKGFMYLMAIMDLYSRRVVHWGLSNTMDATWCAEILQEALEKGEKPEIFNTDQGSQFNSDIFTGVVSSSGIHISMDGKGRATDNAFIERLWRSLKQEKIYLNMYENGKDLYQGVKEWITYYNQERGHKSLGYKTPNEMYKAA